MTTDASIDLIHRLYIAVLGRPADSVALQTYGKWLDDSPGNQSKVLLAVATSNEAADIYGGRGAAEIIDIIHHHVFAKSPDAVVRARLAAQLESGATGLDGIVSLVMTSVGASDIEAYNAKLAAAKAFMALIDTPRDVHAYSGERANNLARDYLDDVRDSASLSAATNAIKLDALMVAIGAVAPVSNSVLIDAQVQEMYIAFFGRAADYHGLRYWANLFNGKPSDAIQDVVAAAFGDAREYRETYGGKSSAVMVDMVYQNLFGRAGEAKGVQYWSALLDKGALGLHNVAKAIAEGALGTDLFAYDAKVTVSSAISAQIDTPAETLAYSDMGANKVVYDYIARVKDAVTFAAAIDPLAIQKLIEGLPLGVGVSSDLPAAAAGPHNPALIVGSPITGIDSFY